MHISFLLFSTLASIPALASPVLGEAAENAIEQRATGPPTNYACGGRWGVISNAQSVSNAFGKLPSGTGAGHQACNGAKSCRTLVCNSGVALAYCNDNTYPKCVDNDDIKTRFRQEIDHCYQNVVIGGNPAHNFAGQAFYQDNTNVIIHGC